jgi:hypothetical protein
MIPKSYGEMREIAARGKVAFVIIEGKRYRVLETRPVDSTIEFRIEGGWTSIYAIDNLVEGEPDAEEIADGLQFTRVEEDGDARFFENILAGNADLFKDARMPLTPSRALFWLLGSYTNETCKLAMEREDRIALQRKIEAACTALEKKWMDEFPVGVPVLRMITELRDALGVPRGETQAAEAAV